MQKILLFVICILLSLPALAQIDCKNSFIHVHSDETLKIKIMKDGVILKDVISCLSKFNLNKQLFKNTTNSQIHPDLVLKKGQVLKIPGVGGGTTSAKKFGIDYRYTKGSIEASELSREIDISAHSVIAFHEIKLKKKFYLQLQAGIKKTDATVDETRSLSDNLSDLQLVGRGKINYRQTRELTLGVFYDLDRYFAVADESSSDLDFTFVMKHSLGSGVSYQLPNNFWASAEFAIILPTDNDTSAIKSGHQLALMLGHTWKKFDLAFSYEKLAVKTEDYDDQGSLISLNLGYLF